MSQTREQKLETCRKKLDSLFEQYGEVSARLSIGTPDPILRATLVNQQAALEEQIKQTETELTNLEKGLQVYEHLEDVEREVRKAWDDSAHEINYDYARPPMNGLTSIFDSLNCIEGGAAFFLIPEQTRMRSESLINRLRRWISVSHQARYCARPLTLDTLDEDGVISALLRQFGLPDDGTRTERVNRLVDALFTSYPEKNTVVALEISVRLPRLSPEVFSAFVRWFLQSIWKPITERLTNPRVSFWRVAVFLLTDLKAAQCPADVCVQPPLCETDKLIMVSILPWEEKDLINWLAKYSRLDDFEYALQEFQGIAYDAYSIGDGVPYPTWARLRELLNDELQHILARIQNGELAYISISG